MSFNQDAQKPKLESEFIHCESNSESTPRYNVVAVGRAYTDIIANVSAEFLQKHQIPIDEQCERSITDLKIIQEQLSQPHMIAGGPSANTVAIISALEGKTGFFGKVYSDKAGHSFLEDLKRSKVDLLCEAYTPTLKMSASCLVLLTDDKRSLVYNPCCSDYFVPTDFDNFDFSITDFFLIEAHLLTSTVAKSTIMNAISQAKNKTEIVINLHGIKQWGGFSDVVQFINSNAYIIIGNKNEQAAFAQTAQSLKLSPLKSQLVIKTKGPEGAEISQNGRVINIAPAEVPKKFVSSVGAGNAFIAGFLLGQSRDMSIEESMRHAVLTATAILGKLGARLT